jgi:DNA mismatch repair protein MutS2
MAFDEATSRPTFRLEVGTPGRSRALDVASRLGFPSQVIERANGLLGAETRRMDELLAEVERSRARVHDAEAATRRAVAEAEAKLRQAEERERAAVDTVSRAKAEAARESARMLEETQALVRETRKKLAAPAASSSEVEASHRAIREKTREAASHRAPAADAPGSDYPAVGNVEPGAKVWSLDLASEVVAEEAPNRRGMVRVSKGGIRFEVSADRLREAPAHAPAGNKRRHRSGGVNTNVSAPERVGGELDLRGQSADEAIQHLERYLDQSILNGGGVVRIVHGKGTGVLRDKVSMVLSQHFAVIDYRLGQPGEGGDGVTVAQVGDR